MDLVGVIFGELEAEEAAVEFFGDDEGGAAAAEGFEDGVAGVGGGFDDAAEELFGHLAAVEAGAFFEGAADAGEVPDVFFGGEAVGGVLGAEDPGVIGKAAFGVGAGVGVDELAGGGDADGVVVEGEVFGVFDEVEEVGVAAGEFEFAVDAEGVVPDDPGAAEESEFALEDHFGFGGEVIADGEPEGAGGFEGADDGGAPLFGPVEVFVGGAAVFVDVVGVADVEGGIGEGEVDGTGGDFGHAGDAVTVIEGVEFHGFLLPAFRAIENEGGLATGPRRLWFRQ